MSDSDGHSLRPLASCAGRDLRDDIFRAISARETDPMGHGALPADDHAADQSARGLLFPIVPLDGAQQRGWYFDEEGLVAGSKMR